jgi:uncharacterized protein YuzE
MISYSPEANAVYIQLTDEEITRSYPVDDARIVDYDAAGHVVGVEFLGASAGIDLRDLPERDRLEAEARVLNFPIFA